MDSLLSRILSHITQSRIICHKHEIGRYSGHQKNGLKNEAHTHHHSWWVLCRLHGVQPRPQGFSLKKWVGPHPFFKGKALGTRLHGVWILISQLPVLLGFNSLVVLHFIYQVNNYINAFTYTLSASLCREIGNGLLKRYTLLSRRLYFHGNLTGRVFMP